MPATTGTGPAPPTRGNGAQKCLVVHPRLKSGGAGRRDPAARLAEAVGLARAIELDVTHAEVVTVTDIRPATLFGSGTVERLGRLIACDAAAEGTDASRKRRAAKKPAPKVQVVVVDAPLSPVQQRNLERAWNCKVVDRTGLILEIFGARARTREGRLQVELAALTYQKSRLVRSWTHLERQRGGFGFLGGPGETQIETDRRIIGERILRLKREIDSVKRTRQLHRRARRRVPYPVVALVGYTNAGKSTLFNQLTKADVVARDQLFATLDPTMRGFALPSGRMAILSDTVGFISDLPHELVTAFHATLEEVCEADLILHVRDVAHPESEAQKLDVLAVLRELGLEAAIERNLVEVLNKIDLLSPENREALLNRVARANTPMVALSALTGEGCEVLLALLDDRLSAGLPLMEIAVAPEDGAALAWLYKHGEVVERHDSESAIRLKVRLDSADAARFARRRAPTPS